MLNFIFSNFGIMQIKINFPNFNNIINNLPIVKQINAKEGFPWKVYNIADQIGKRFSAHNIYLTAAGIAFNILLYFIPLLMIAIFVSTFFLDSQTTINTIEKLIFNLLPRNESTYNFFQSILVEINKLEKGRTASGIIGVITLLWISSTFISSIRSGLDRIYEIKTTKIFVIYKLKDVLVAFATPILLIIYAVSVPILTYVLSMFNQILPEFMQSTWLTIGVNLFSFIFTIGIFFLAYEYIPSKTIKRTISLYSSIMSGVLVVIARLVFGWYLTTTSRYGTLYGAYAAIVSIAVWIYYLSFIILFSAEISKFIYQKRTKQTDILQHRNGKKNKVAQTS